MLRLDPLQVSCIGQLLCAVVADTRAHAKRGASAVKISYEDLPEPVFTVEVCENRLSTTAALSESNHTQNVFSDSIIVLIFLECHVFSCCLSSHVVAGGHREVVFL